MHPTVFAVMTAVLQAQSPGPIVPVSWLAEHLNEPGLRIIDARPASEYQQSHIPGAVNRFFKRNLDETGRFKPAAELKGEFTDLLGDRPAASIVHQCGSGVTACHNLLAMEIAGLAGSLLYPGSWSEWVADRSRPVATGN